MYLIREFFDMLFAKCETRGQQIGLVLGMAVLVAGCYGCFVFFLGFSEAAVESVAEAQESGLDPDRYRRRGSGGGQALLIAFVAIPVTAILGALFALIGAVNALRLVTGTGLKDPDDSW